MSRYQGHVLAASQHMAHEKKIGSADTPEPLRKDSNATHRLHNGHGFERRRGDHRIGSEFHDDTMPLHIRLYGEKSE